MRFFSKKSSKKFGGNEKVRIFAARFGKNDEFSRLKRKFIDNNERENEVKKQKREVE